MYEADKAFQEKNITKAIKLYKKSARGGEDEALFKLGKIYYNGRFIKRDISKAMGYFKQVASYGHKKAKFNVAVIYGQKKYKNHSYKKSYEIFLDLAREHHPKAQFMVANALLKGLGTQKDYPLALKWLEQSYFKNGYEPSRCMLAVVYANGLGVIQNLGRARVLAQNGFDKKTPICTRVYKEFNLHKYESDKSFKFGFYRDL
ncbi:MAG: tetratricopeptide repeat protein [Campylobacterota bacterium]|nr:tetratricopeptide repeat protein [Campylobacterota bacterium]